MRRHRAVDQNVDMSERLDHPLDHRFDFVALAQVDGDGESASAFLTHFFRRCIRISLLEINARNIAAFGRESWHNGGAKFSVAARHNRDFSFEFHRFTEPVANRPLSIVRSFFA
jgi:hypothetical protein